MNSRRKFLIVTTVTLTSPLFSTVQNYEYAKEVNIYSGHFQTIALLYNDLFAKATKKDSMFKLIYSKYFYHTLKGHRNDNNFPSVKELGSVEYLAGVLDDSRIEQSSRDYILNGVMWLDETADEMFSQKRYYLLSSDERQQLLKNISSLNWGDNWLWTMMRYYFESMFCDPIYGGNKNKSGWKWLNYTPGHPRPVNVKSGYAKRV
jgi:hypothetical protein